MRGAFESAVYRKPLASHPLPGNLLNRGLLPWIRNHTAILLDPAAVQQANARLDEVHRATDRKAAARDHVKALKARTTG